MQGWVVIAVALAYIGLLFLVASYGDRTRGLGRKGRTRLLIYPLSLAIYCTSWTFFGSVGSVSRTGFEFLTIYIGPVLMIGLFSPLLIRIVRLANGSEYRGYIVISAADGRTTIFDMLEGKYVDDKVRGFYDRPQLFPPLVYVGLGMARKFEDVAPSVAGMSFPLKEPVKDFVLAQPDGAIAEILHVFKLLREFNIKLGYAFCSESR